MKSSTMMAIAFCGVLAFAVSGCKYDDEPLSGDDIATGTEVPAEGEGVDNAMAGGQDVATDPDAANAGAANAGDLANAGADMSGITDESGVPATGLPFDQDPNYVRCTDVAFEPVYFGFDASNLQPSEMSKIEAVATHLKQTGRVVIVEGNCDERGSNEYNLSSSRATATSVVPTSTTSRSVRFARPRSRVTSSRSALIRRRFRRRATVRRSRPSSVRTRARGARTAAASSRCSRTSKRCLTGPDGLRVHL